MGTPSSTNSAVVRAQAAAASIEKGRSGGANPKQDRSALLDITNDSPIVGVATQKTPATWADKSNKCCPLPRKTPGSGEALLRGQVRTLLHKVEESKLVKPPPTVALRPFIGHLRSPSELLAPTPANTPLNLGVAQEEQSDDVDNVERVSLEIDVSTREEQLGECQINRALLFDSPEKSDGSTDSSTLTFQGSSHCSSVPGKLSEDDCSSIWSIQANAGSESAQDELLEAEADEEEDDYYHCKEDNDDDDEEEGFYFEENDGARLDDLCESLGNMWVGSREKNNGLPEFKGKHVRFLYNSDGELEGEEEVVVLGKALPNTEGRHLLLRFQEEEDE